MPWQDYMRADPLLRWMLDARNHVTKSGILVAQSRVLVEVMYSYKDRPTVRVDVDPEQLDEDILVGACRSIPPEISANASVRLERRWEIDDLPGLDVIKAVEGALQTYGALVADFGQLLHAGESEDAPSDAVARLEGEIDLCKLLPGGKWYRADTMDELAFADMSALRFPTNDPAEPGQPPEFLEIPDELTQLMDRAMSHDLEVAAKAQFEAAKFLLEHQGVFASAVWLRYGGRRGRRGWRPLMAQYEDRAEKYFFIDQLAEQAVAEDCDAVILLSEAWVYDPDDWESLYANSGEVEPVGEALSASAASADCTQWAAQAHFTREGDSIRFERSSLDPSAGAVLWPFLRRWGCDVGPEEQDSSE